MQLQAPQKHNNAEQILAADVSPPAVECPLSLRGGGIATRGRKGLVSLSWICGASLSRLQLAPLQKKQPSVRGGAAGRSRHNPFLLLRVPCEQKKRNQSRTQPQREGRRQQCACGDLNGARGHSKDPTKHPHKSQVHCMFWMDSVVPVLKSWR
eukprot:gene23577-biopygen17827